MEVLYNLIGGVTHEEATIASKLAFIPPEGGESALKIMRLEYYPNNFNVYINGELVGSDSTRSGNFSYIYNLMLGSDADNVSFLKGYIPELLIYKNTPTLVESAEIERWLADKWLATGTDINGYTVQETESNFPSTTNVKWLHFDETSLNVTNGKVTSISDKAAFQGVTKIGTPVAGAVAPTLEVGRFKNKDVARYNGEENFIVPGLNQPGDPDYFTMFIVYRFDDIYDSTGDQTLIGAITNDVTPSYNNAIRIKQYTSDGHLDVRANMGGFSYAAVPMAKAYGLDFNPPNILLGTQQLVYTEDSAFINGLMYSDTVSSYTAQNGNYKFKLTGLEPFTKYYVKVILDGVVSDEVLSFTTHPVVGTPTSFKFIAGSCNYTGSDADTWDEMRLEEPLFWSHLGDWHYEDIGANNLQLYRNAFSLTAGAPKLRKLNQQVPLAYMFDDHDYGPNNSDKDSTSKPAAIGHYLENVPHYPLNGDPLTNTICQAWTIGRVRFIMTDMRSQRTNFLDDDFSLTKTMMGSVQKAWFKSQLLDAKNDTNIQLICWLNPSPWTGEETDGYSWDYGSSGEHWTAYKVERTELYNFILDNEIKNIFIINGDTHQQAIDDGRNAIFDNVNGKTIDWRTLDPNILTPVIESSPFDKDVSRGSGPFQINDLGDSGSVGVLSERTYTTFDITDEGENWIKVDVKQYVLPDGITGYTEKTLINYYSFIRDCDGTPGIKPKLNNKEYKKLEGTFTIPAGTHTIIENKFEFTSPERFENNWKAPIAGRVLLTDLDNKIIRMYRRADIDYEVGEAVINPSDGTFLLQGNMGISLLVFKVWDTVSNTIVEEFVNDGNYGSAYSDIEAGLYYTTDIDYLQETKTIPITNEFSFGYSDSGQKVKIKLTEKSTGNVLAESSVLGDLPRSYELAPNDPDLQTPFAAKSYLYDAGLSLISLTGMRDYEFATIIAKGIMDSQLENGAVPFSANHINPKGSDPYLRTGAIAWTGYALAFYLKHYTDSPIKLQVEESLDALLQYILTLKDDTNGGMFKGGSGRYITINGIETFDPYYIIPWISAEHNIDSYFTFKLAAEVLNRPDYLTISNQIGSSLINILWNGTRMYQGINGDGTPDTADALDINSWGAIAMVALGRIDIAEILLARADRYYYTTDETTGAKGYKPYSSELGYPNAKDTVWFEGSFGVALAYRKCGNNQKFNEIMNDLFDYVEVDGAFRYATLRDQVYEIGNNKSMASTSWAVIANSLFNIVWT